MKIYDDIFFVIDKENYNENRQDLFFGYKTVDDEGFWLDVKHRPTKIHIYTSAISPVIVIYKKDNYWAISNSCYYLNEFLKDKGINLKVNEKFLELESKKQRSFSYNYEKDILLYEDLFINDNDEEIDIVDGELNLVKKDFKLFQIDAELNLDILFNWYQKYFNYLSTRNDVIVSLSGGLDSRLLWYLFLRQNKNCKIESYFNKPNVTDNIDGELSKKVIETYSDKTVDIVNRTKLVEEWQIKDEDNSDLAIKCKRFNWGITYNPMKTGVDKVFRVVGTGSNLFRYEFQDLKFLNGNIRRNWVTNFILKYYVQENTFVCPYMDSLLLQLDTKSSDYLHVMLYSIFGKSLLTDGIPFITKSKLGKYKFQEFRKDLFDRFSNICNI